MPYVLPFWHLEVYASSVGFNTHRLALAHKVGVCKAPYLLYPSNAQTFIMRSGVRGSIISRRNNYPLRGNGCGSDTV